MANTKGAANFRNSASSGKQSFLPPKSPFPTMPVSYSDYGTIGSKGIPKPREGHRHHQRTSSESFLEEQPSWLDELLNEPETPVKRGAHRRSTSDSFAYLDGANIYANMENLSQEEGRQRGITSQTLWGAQDFDRQHAPYYAEANSFGKPQNRGWETMNMVNYPSGALLAKDKTVHPGSTCVPRDADAATSNVTEKKEQEQSPQDSKGISERKKEGSHAKQFDVDPKRVKQQFAQRSRVRKLQYIAELERNVQALQAEGMEVSAELEFLDQQNLILNLENKALKQRLDSLAQEHLIKRFQQEMLEREIARLRSLYQQQQQQLQQPPAPTHGRSSSRDLESRFANLSLKHEDPNSGRDPVTGPLNI
ncbi:uncharacterized protein At4g06598 [Elaeis guineensis]|uniref:Uncharacterized protein At4g06598 n=1 Tax=Elaeis guineensis var. tenera TaxID=51953 RepID=A0A6I9QNW6_ELAGV|nr:uncharacterized protein At4g06598 [Elaeis guineensis]XP_019704230.1 uncharacterized protein At4g06598 [Elaeis guineensis]XP_029118406.1 uncharacterized protein At4g06598 [Elaeis guineensis]XP_029118407.1 uncharacterized protein At4g06598 [Elaeis guineensis]